MVRPMAVAMTGSGRS